MWKAYRDFIARGNVIDLAVAVVIGLAFAKVVASFVADVLMPPIGLILGRTDFSNLFLALDGRAYPSLLAAKAAGAPVIAYGSFVNTIIEFLIITFAVFLLLQQLARFLPRKVPTVTCAFCASNIPAPAIRCPECTSDLRQKPGAVTFVPGDGAAVAEQATPSQG